MSIIKTFLAMGGYGLYVWPAYGLVALALGLQWLLPWKRWRKMRRAAAPQEQR